MKIFTVMFDVDRCKTWTRLLDVFRESVHEQMPDVELVEKTIKKPPRNPHRPKNVQYNTVKLVEWINYMDTATEDTIFIDCDMLCLQPAHRVFNYDFDVAVTFRPVGSLPPMNGGVVFARPTNKAREFFRLWLDVNNQMYADPPFHHTWRRKYLGMNQAAFGYMYESGMCDGVEILSTQTWNAVDDDWKNINGNKVFVHIKSALRRGVMQDAEPYGDYKTAMDAWYRIEDRLLPRYVPANPPSIMNPGKRLKKRKKIDYRKAKPRGRSSSEKLMKENIG